MHRPAAQRPRSQICQICRSISAREFHTPIAKPSFVALGAGRQRLQIPREISLGAPSRLLSRPYSAPKVPRQRRTAKVQANAASTDGKAPEVAKLVASVEQARDSLLNQGSIPAEADVSVALRTCEEAANVIMDATIRPHLGQADAQAGTAASNLLLLDMNGTKASQTAPLQALEPGRVRDVIDAISEAAYAIVAHPNVFITPQLLEQYVNIQARLGMPDTLPHVFSLYASKPLAKGASDAIKYVKQNPDKAANAVEPEIAEKALDVAIEAKNLDAAVGIIESTYSTKAFIRAKLVRKALVPAGALAAAPIGAYLIATNLSHFQDTMDEKTATTLAFAGILAYVGFTASIGAVAVMTQNDQMRRVTWAPGIPLRQRWLREDERAALDKVACSFGFSEPTRWGEEEGTEFQALREYILRKGMILDAVELMDGMS
ncbi:Major facilitator superfamily domain-containing protein [Pleurostoma richardsiae]|uniref:Major facilitator superfamily domain-containing protein n=1 Tax=Pleurostoma richardsiae TaxID=41990 RepID=A0AA38SDL2_9PEZI|nr:Major facilitator superfamily domain-containing protein [Pleurostoma richardsiae]